MGKVKWACSKFDIMLPFTTIKHQSLVQPMQITCQKKKINILVSSVQSVQITEGNLTISST